MYPILVAISTYDAVATFDIEVETISNEFNWRFV